METFYKVSAKLFCGSMLIALMCLPYSGFAQSEFDVGELTVSRIDSLINQKTYDVTRKGNTVILLNSKRVRITYPAPEKTRIYEVVHLSKEEVVNDIEMVYLLANGDTFYYSPLNKDVILVPKGEVYNLYFKGAVPLKSSAVAR